MVSQRVSVHFDPSAHPDFFHRVSQMMSAAWTEPGFCVPNASVYPHQWLWDSCFHAVIWSRLDPERGLREVENSLAKIGPTGFVAHMTYWSEPSAGKAYWGRPETSSITQPPMWGLAIAELEAVGVIVPVAVKAQAAKALLHPCRRRQATPTGLVPAYHPWETGCDDTPRWDAWATDNDPTRFDQARWMVDKRRFLDALRFDEHNAPIGTTAFAVGSVGHNALIAWNARLLARSLKTGGIEPGDTPAELVSVVVELQTVADRLSTAISSRWNDEVKTWEDEPVVGAGPSSSRVRTADALLSLLVDPRPEGFQQLVDPEAFGGPFGPTGVHRAEPSYRPERYWRGSNWPQINYLLFQAARQAQESGDLDPAVSETLARGLIAGADTSGLAEYWHPDSGQGFGAKPQTWAGLAICV